MFSQSAPWLKEFPEYTPPEQTHQKIWVGSCPLVRRTRRSRSAENVNYQFVIEDSATVEQSIARRLSKQDTRRLRRYQTHRMHAHSAGKVMLKTAVAFGWLVPLYLASHAAMVGAVAHKATILLQTAVAHSALKTWLSTVCAALIH